MTTADRIQDAARRDRDAAAAIQCPLCHATVGTNGHRMNGKDCVVQYRAVVLTKSERDAIDWAADPMRDFWTDASERAEEGCQTYHDPLHTTATGCEIVDDTEVLADLRYRLLEQLPDMNPEQPRNSPEYMDFLRAVKAARSAFAKIEVAFIVVPIPVATSQCIDCGARFPDDGGGDAVCPKCAQNYGD